MNLLKKILTTNSNKKWIFFGVQTNIEWYDIKTKFKQLLRKITYSWLFQELICLIAIGYMKFIYYVGKQAFVNREVFENAAKNNKPLLLVFWHNRLLMVPLAAQEVIKSQPHHVVMTLSSKHGDGKIVGRIMEKLGMTSISGSSKDSRKSSRGIDIASFKRIFSGLKKGYSLAITPDGPRGPAQKINGEIINIARISGAGILAVSYSASHYKILNSWDKFKIPLPFSKLVIYCDDQVIFIPKNADDDELKRLTNLVEERMNLAQEESQKLLGAIY